MADENKGGRPLKVGIDYFGIHAGELDTDDFFLARHKFGEAAEWLYIKLQCLMLKRPNGTISINNDEMDDFISFFCANTSIDTMKFLKIVEYFQKKSLLKVENACDKTYISSPKISNHFTNVELRREYRREWMSNLNNKKSQKKTQEKEQKNDKK